MTTVPHASASLQSAPARMLSWRRDDLEQRIGFKGGRFTSVNTLLSLLIAIAIWLTFYGALFAFPNLPYADMFLNNEWTPFVMSLLGLWSAVILTIKYRKLCYQRRTLKISILPDAPDFVISPSTAPELLETLQITVDDPKYFMLFNRISVALSNLKNLGRITDVDEILRSQAEHDESTLETSYSLLRGFVWAIPVLGFIGTVLGLSTAIGGFTDVLTSSDVNNVDEIVGHLQGVTGGLGNAFETTLVALVIALVVQLAMTFLKKQEEEFLDDCSNYCQKNIVNRLRITPFDQ